LITVEISYHRIPNLKGVVAEDDFLEGVASAGTAEKEVNGFLVRAVRRK